jgi:hypothetical protein
MSDGTSAALPGRIALPSATAGSRLVGGPGEVMDKVVASPAAAVADVGDGASIGIAG